MLSDAPPAHECVIQAAMPQDIEAARAARLAGDYDHARCALERAIAAEPDSADAFVELGFLNLATGDEDAARQAFERALALAPDYDDAKYGLAQLAFRSDDHRAARSWLERVSAERHNDPDVIALHSAVDHAVRLRATWRWDAFAGYSTLSDGLSPWREASLAVNRRRGRGSLGFALEHAERFDREDTFAELRLSRRYAHGAWGLAIGGADSADFRPEAAVRVEYASPEDDRTSFSAALTLARYGVGQVDTLSVRARRQIAPDVHLDARGILVQDEADDLRTGYGAGAVWRARRWLWLDITFVDAPESSEGVTVDVRSATLGLSAEVSPDTRVRLGVMREDRAVFSRTEIALSVARTF